jgi:hypothetical protein
MCHTSNTPSKNIIDKSNTNINTLTTLNTQNNSNIILNQNHQGVPCYNNINIYTTGLSSMKNTVANGNGNANNNSSVDNSLKNYISNKVSQHRKSPSMNRININKSNTKQKVSINHSKSNSIVGKL